jgi:hypothetical protein
LAKRLTLKDFDIRYRKIRKQNPKVKTCSVHGCPNPRDFTPLAGEDTCCAYHRLLFDFWFCEIAKIRAHDVLKMSQKGRRRAFSNFLGRTGKETLDELVLKMAEEPVNWEC